MEINSTETEAYDRKLSDRSRTTTEMTEITEITENNNGNNGNNLHRARNMQQEIK